MFIVGLYLIKEYDYVFYISPEGLPIEDNSIRTIDPIYRDNIDREIKRLLTKYKPTINNYHEINGSIEERIQQVLEKISS